MSDSNLQEAISVNVEQINDNGTVYSTPVHSESEGNQNTIPGVVNESNNSTDTIFIDASSREGQTELNASMVLSEASKATSTDMLFPDTATAETVALSAVVLSGSSGTSQSNMIFTTTPTTELNHDMTNPMEQLSTSDVTHHKSSEAAGTTESSHEMEQNTALNVAISSDSETTQSQMIFSSATVTSEAENAVTIQHSTLSNDDLSESNKPDDGEMVYTVVAMDNNIGHLMEMDSENLSKEVQLSLVHPSSTEDNTEQATTTSKSLSDINQLAMIAASIEENPKKTPGKKSNKKDLPIKIVKGRVLCPDCDQTFSDVPSMRRHRLIHSDDKPFQCDFCDKSFRRKDNLREHRNIHTQENVYKCKRCGKTFPRKYTHKVHMSRFCGRPSHTTTENLAESLQGGGKPRAGMGASKTSEPCLLCFKTFRDASTLKRHLLTHSDERPYKCNECDKAFRRKDHLQEHVIVHKLVRPFTCQTCGKSFSRKNGLKTHMIRTTHLLGFDSIIVPNQPKDSDKVEVRVTEQGLAVEELVASSSEVFGQGSNGENQPTSESMKIQTSSDSERSGILESSSESNAVSLQFSEMRTNAGNSETTIFVISEKRQDTNPESDVQLGETTSQAHVMKVYLCPTCNVTFPEKEELWTHFQDHLGANTSACQRCFQVFESVELFEEHRKICIDKEDESDFRAEKSSEINEGLSEDNAFDTNDDSQDSVVVESNETREAAVEKNNGHSQNAIDDQNVTVNGGGCETPPNLKKRKRLTTPEKGEQTCSTCGKVFRDSTALRRHSLVHSDERPHACSHCEKRFRRRDHLKAHELAHHSGITSHDCKTCDATFNTRYALTVHSKACKNRPSSPKDVITDEMKLIGNPESKQCPICHKVFKDPSTQRRHFRIHSDERPFHCDICSKSFRRKDNLKEHLLCHSEEKPFTCTHCGKSLSRRSSLTNHQNVCTALKSGVENASMISSSATLASDSQPPVMAEIQFAEPAAVQELCVSGDTQEISAAHLLATGLTSSVVTSSDITTLDVTSSDITPSSQTEEEMEQGLREDAQDGSGNIFPCQECGKSFRTKWTLRFHRRIHTGEKPHACTTCDRQFRQGSHLKIHERTHTGERPYPCNICGRGFIDSSTMKRHERLHKESADPNAIIDERHDVIQSQDEVITPQHDIIESPNDVVTSQNDVMNSEHDVINTQDDVTKSTEYVISNGQVIEDRSVVEEAVDIAHEGAIQLLVTTANELASSPQPISTSVVSEMNQSGTMLVDSQLRQMLSDCIRNQGVEKIDTLAEWQGEHASEPGEHLMYIQTEEPSDETD